MNTTKKLKIVAVVLCALGLLGFTVFAAIMLANHQAKSSHAPACAGDGTDHAVLIDHDKASPGHLTARRCDRLTITNDDNSSRLVAFGLHEHHEPYDGVTERLLTQGQSLTVTLNQAGSFRFHDHLHDEVQGYFTVTGQ